MKISSRSWGRNAKRPGEDKEGKIDWSLVFEEEKEIINDKKELRLEGSDGWRHKSEIILVIICHVWFSFKWSSSNINCIS